jgi:amidase
MRAILLVLLLAAQPAFAASYDVVEKDIATLQADLGARRVTSVELVRAYQARIAALDRAGPKINSVLILNPDAMVEARALDAERAARGPRGPLHGIPIFVKDNIETLDPMPTTAGSLALAHNLTRRDAPVVARLRAAGAIILGKTNLSEWANIRSTHSISGWSSIGGLTRNPYVLDRSTCGSSAGSGAAVAASLAAAALGTETNGSLVCPGSFNGIVALKPTVGLVSRTHVVPISHTQDTPGPMTRTVADAALLLGIMAGSDVADAATAPADANRRDYGAALAPGALAGKRLGVIVPPGDSSTDKVFAGALAILRAAGAEIVQVPDFTRPADMLENEAIVLKFELKSDMAAYLASLPGDGPKSLDDLIAFNAATPRELALFGQENFVIAAGYGGLSDPIYVKAHAVLGDGTRALLDRTLKTYRLDALIRPTAEPAFRLDVAKGDNSGVTAAGVPAIAGYPHLTVPMGAVQGLPVGLSFMGPPWSESLLLALGADFERRAAARRPPQFLPSLEQLPATDAALQPLSNRQD